MRIANSFARTYSSNSIPSPRHCCSWLVPNNSGIPTLVGLWTYVCQRTDGSTGTSLDSCSIFSKGGISMSGNGHGLPPNITSSVSSSEGKHVVLMVEDHRQARPELKQVLIQQGYRVIDTDNGQDAAQHARQNRPDLLVVDMDVPLLYELVAARQIVKHARVGSAGSDRHS